VKLKRKKSVTGVGVLYETSHKLYQRTGVNVVGAALNGYYVYEEGKIIKCTGNSECDFVSNSAVTSFEGYVLNADHNTFKENQLIYCKDMDHCNIQPKEANGYYLSKVDSAYNENYVVCDKYYCIERNIADKDEDGKLILKNVCTNNKYKIIFDEGSGVYKFCESSTTAIDIAVDYKLITDNFAPERKLNYPTKMGEDVRRAVLFKITDYSVVAMNGDSKPIGYIKSGNGYIECRFGEEGGRVCETAEIAEACTAEVIGKLFNDQGTKKLCIDSKENANIVVNLSVAAENDAEGEYVLPLGSGLFGISGPTDGTYYTIVEVEDGHVKLKKESKYVKQKYTDYDTTNNRSLYKIFSKEDAEGTNGTADSICTIGSNRPFEFVLKLFGIGSDANPNVDYYIEGDNSGLQA